MILASKSPRRKEILESVGFNLKIISVDIDECSDEIDICDKIKDIAYKKVKAVADRYSDEYVVGADTIVELDGEIIGKPKDEREAYEILKRLSGRTHNVITAYSFINRKKNLEIKDCSVTKVYFKELSDEMIEWYIGTKEPMDKAGAYGIQEKGAIFVEKIEGDFFTVMGFPIERFMERLLNLGVKLKEIERI